MGVLFVIFKMKTQSDNKAKIHRNWIIGLIIITVLLCGTVIWLNYNSWTLRFEMDANTLEAIKSIDWKELNNVTK